MMMIKRFLGAFLATSILFTGTIQTVQAAMISTAQVADTAMMGSSSHDDREKINSMLSREDVQSELVARGIDPIEAQSRVAQLSDDEASSLASQLDKAPAGGSIIGAIVLVFFVLLLTDILGFTKIYPFTRSIR